MSNNVNIYYDGDSFCQATAIFTDPNLTAYAPSLWSKKIVEIRTIVIRTLSTLLK